MGLARVFTSITAIFVLATLTACERQAKTPLPSATPPASVTELFDQLSSVSPPPQGSRAKALVDAAKAPVADSPQIETAPKEHLLERVGGETIDLASLLPPSNAEVPGAWNGWYVDHAIDAFRSAIEQNKPLVLVISEDWCDFCVRMITDSLRCPGVDRFAGSAVFALAAPSRDKGAVAIAGSLNITAYPTITVLEPDPRMLLERGRINGYFEGGKLGEHLETILWKTPQRVYVDQWGAETPLPQQKTYGPNTLNTWNGPPDSAGTIAAARTGATERGLKHTPPTPRCL